jgi:putative ABC transport system substrate-binding protein
MKLRSALSRFRRRRRFLAAAAAALAAVSLPTLAQTPDRPRRIGFLAGGIRPKDGRAPARLRAGLAEAGHIDGRDVVYEARWAEGDFARLAQLADELVYLRCDAIVVVGWQPTQALARATTTIPIVTVAAGDALGTGLVSSLSRPGKNVTGLSDMAIELAAKRMQILKEAVPAATRIAVLWNADDRAMTLRYGEIESAARTLGINVQPVAVRRSEDFDTALSKLSRERPDALFLVSDVLTAGNRRRVIEYAAANRVPSMYEYASYVEDGGLLSYGPSLDDIFYRAAYYVDRIIKGTKVGDLPMEQPTRTYLYINARTATELGLSIPPTVLYRADKVLNSAAFAR